MGVLERTDLPKGANPGWTIPQGYERYGEADHRIWTTLYERQADILPGRACDAFLHGLEALDLHGHGIPDFRKLNEKLLALTGWRVVAVPGLVPDAVFFEHLANRRFPAANFIRGAGELDYLQEPDIFHDVFGHVPMLTDPVFADYMEAYGKGGLRALSLGHLANLARLYWYTVEFGLWETSEGLRIYGAGIVSSRTESIFALASDSPNRLGFDLERVMRTLYRIDGFQQVYFVVASLQHLLDVTTGTDFGPLYNKISRMPDIPIESIEPGDKVFTRGTQEYANRGGRVRQIANSVAGRNSIMRDKVVVITGGFGELGHAVADAALAAGAFVALPGREPADKIAPRERLLVLGGVDLTDFAGVRQAFETAAARFGKIDGLANVAGGFRWQTLGDGDLAGWTDQFAMNLLTAATAIKAALPYLRASQGAIVNVASAPAKKAGAGMGAYAASKAGVLRLTESVAEEEKSAGVRVNAVLPTIIDTPRNRADMPKADFTRWVKPEDIAKTILFLLSSDAKAITGAEILISGRT